ncbi:MAG: hypothetical protein KGR48_07950 [Alphaproteobacteria bacterium]|nr:hypothetical protein [Alphaproteobacteria bacterium]MBU6474089.1 hypothetical protein [Alphaproteobacteria bacterium]MDE2012066.1 hypothetical protein [Alphaproteobacteria bacterium]MDE2075266.1 hypothetical protein [Alphaproteobacteria bacterium]
MSVSKSTISSKILATVGTLFLIIAALTLVLITKEVVIAIRFSGGGDMMSQYIVGRNLGRLVFDCGVAAVFGGLGGFMVRRQLRERKPRIALGIGIAVALLLGINAGLM